MKHSIRLTELYDHVGIEQCEYAVFDKLEGYIWSNVLYRQTDFYGAEGYCNRFDGSLLAENKQNKLIEQYECAKKSLEETLQTKEKQYQQTIQDLEEQNQQNLHDKEKQIQQLMESERENQQTLLNKEGHIQQLMESERGYQRVIASQQEQIAKLQEAERELDRVKQTKSYRFTHWLRRGFDKVFPVYTKRRFFAKLLYKFITHPLLVLRMLRPRHIKNFFYALKTEGMQGVEYYYSRRERMTRQEMNHEDALNLVAPVSSTHKTIAEYVKFELPVWEHPQVSIVIPVYNEFDYTYNCLKSILKNSGNITYEVIFANDCSTDFTTEIEKII